MMNPKLRPLQLRPAQYRGQRVILLHDPLQISTNTVYLPQRLAPLLPLLDGSRDANQIRAAFMVRTGIPITTSAVTELLSQLDEASLLDNDRFREAYAAALEAFRSAPFRPPILAGESYPAEPEKLRSDLQKYLDTAQETHASAQRIRSIRGLISPHIDFARGGSVYGAVWCQANEASRSADLVIILGTDHLGDDALFTLTRQNYATPLGVLETDQQVVRSLAQALGEEAFRDELHHRSEHSVELALTWLHLMRQGRPCRVVPLLCGSFERYIQGQAEPAQDPLIAEVVSQLQQAISTSSALVIAAGDLAHEGPAFGDSLPVDFVRRAMSKAADERLMKLICAGDAEGFFQELKIDGDRRHVCGLPPIYLTLRILDGVQGQVVAYDQCPADEQGTSIVSVCGITFS